MSCHIQKNQQKPVGINFFAEVQKSDNLNQLTQLFNRAVQCNALTETKTARDLISQKTLFYKFIKKTKKLKQSDFLNLKLFFQSLESLIKEPRFPSFASIPFQQIPSTDLDIDEKQLTELKQYALICRTKNRYQQSIANWKFSGCLPNYLLNLDLKETQDLFKKLGPLPSHSFAYSLKVSNLHQFTYNFIFGRKDKHDAENLLKEAIQKNHPYVVKYLLHIGVRGTSTSSFIKDFKNDDIFSLAHNLPGNKQLEIIKSLYEKREPISTALFSEVLFYTLQLYLPPVNTENRNKNHQLLDNVVSHLLNVNISIKNLTQYRSKYIGHSFGLKEGDISRKGDPLEGFSPENYMQLHLRLFFQKIVETVKDSGDIDTSIINEFLCELETGWVIQQIVQSLAKFTNHQSLAKFTNHQSLLKKFIEEALVPYTRRQIENISIGSEYVVYTGLPMHSIYVAFRKLDKERVRIRVDNLGGFSRDSKTNYERHIADINFKDPSQRHQLNEYLKLLFNSTCFHYKKPFTKKQIDEFHNVGYEYVKNIYNVNPKSTLFNSPQDPETYQEIPQQSVGNCTHYSLLIGQVMRLGNNLGNNFDNFFMSLSALLNKTADELLNKTADELLKKLADEDGHHLDIPERSSINYNSWVKQKLLNQYNALEANCSAVPLMESNMIKANSFSSLLSVFLPRDPNGYYNSPPNLHLCVLGDAGSGKTMLSQQVAYQFQSNKKLDCVVFYLRLRDLLEISQNESSWQLINLVEKYVFKRTLPSYEKPFVQALIDDSKTIWVVDGLDELIVNSALKECLKQLFTRERVIVTSRPHFSVESLKEVIDIKTFDSQFKIGPYPQEEQIKLIDYYFSNPERLSISSEQRLLKEELKKILDFKQGISPILGAGIRNGENLNPDLKYACDLPISLIQVCKLLALGHKDLLKETNLSAINHTFINSMLINAHQKKSRISAKGSVAIKEKYSKVIDFIEKLAFKSLEHERKTHFSAEVTDQVFPSDHNYREIIEKKLKEIGLVQLDAGGGQFIHASYQEYLTASYIITSLKYSKSTRRYQEAKNFIERHKNDVEYNYNFFCISQIFKDKIHRYQEEKKEEYLLIFTDYLSLFFDEDLSGNLSGNDKKKVNLSSTPKPLEYGKASRRQVSCIAMIGVIYDIAQNQRISANSHLSSFILNRINPTLKDLIKKAQFTSSGTDTNDIQKLLLAYPHLKKELELSDFIIQEFKQLKESHEKNPIIAGVKPPRSYFIQEDNPILNKIRWILSFIVEFNLSIPLDSLCTLSEFCKKNQLDHLESLILKAIETNLPDVEEGLNLPEEIAQEINRLISVELKKVSHNTFSTIVSISEKLKKNVDLKNHFIETTRNLIDEHDPKASSYSKLSNFIKFLKEERLFNYADDQIILPLAESGISLIFPDLAHFLLDYISKLAKGRDSTQLKKIENALVILFKNWSTSGINSDELNKKHKMLKDLKEILTKNTEPEDSVKKVFDLWDLIIVPSHFLTACALGDNLDNIRKFIAHPPILNDFTYNQNHANAIKNQIVDLARNSLVSNKRKLGTSNGEWIRDLNWRSIKEFLGDQKVIDFFDMKGFSDVIDKVIDKLIIFYIDSCARKDTKNSGVPGDIYQALSMFNRKQELCSQLALNRINRISKVLNLSEPFEVLQTVDTNDEAAAPTSSKPVASNDLASHIPKSSLEFDFDFSYYAYSQTLKDLRLIISKNPKWLKEKMPSVKIEELKQLKINIEKESKPLNAIKNLEIIEELLSVFDGSITKIKQENLASLGTHFFELSLEAKQPMNESKRLLNLEPFSFNGQKFKRQVTRGFGSCALHASLGYNFQGVYRYSKKADSDLEVKRTFIDALSLSFTKDIDPDIRLLYLDNLSTLLEEAQKKEGDSLIKSIFFGSQTMQQDYIEWQVNDFLIKSSIDEQILKEGTFWTKLIQDPSEPLASHIKNALKNSGHEWKENVDSKTLVGWIDEDRKNIEKLLLTHPQEEPLLKLRHTIELKRKERDVIGRNFLQQSQIWDQYKETFLNPNYYLNSIEIHIAALLFNKRITILHWDQNKETVERSENDFNENGQEHVYIFHEGNHFEKCIEEK